MGEENGEEGLGEENMVKLIQNMAKMYQDRSVQQGNPNL